MRRIFLLLIIPSMLNACATTYDPAKVCTAEWIKPRADRAVNDIRTETNSAIKSIRKVATAFRDGKTPGPIQMFKLSGALKSLEKELKRGQGAKGLKILAKTCDDPKIITDGLMNYVEGLELPPSVKTAVKALPHYKTLIEQHLDDLNKAD